MIKEFDICGNTYSVMADLHENKVVVKFTVYEHTLYEEAPDPLFLGSIKWDGCSNWDFSKQNCALHFCGRNKAVEFGVFLGKLYEWAAELMPDKEVLHD